MISSSFLESQDVAVENRTLVPVESQQK